MVAECQRLWDEDDANAIEMAVRARLAKKRRNEPPFSELWASVCECEALRYKIDEYMGEDPSREWESDATSDSFPGRDPPSKTSAVSATRSDTTTDDDPPEVAPAHPQPKPWADPHAQRNYSWLNPYVTMYWRDPERRLTPEAAALRAFMKQKRDCTTPPHSPPRSR